MALATATITALGLIGAAGASGGAAIYSANRQSGAAEDAARLQTGAANRSADLQSQANAAALAEQQRQANIAQANAEATQRANYEQWKAKEQRLSAIGQMLGLAPRNIPDYVPTNAGAGQGGTGTQGGQTSSGSGGPDALRALLTSGLSPQEAAARFNREHGRTTGNEAVYYPQSNAVSIPEGKFYGGSGGWQWSPDNSGGGGGATTRANTISSLMQTNPSLSASAQQLPFLTGPQVYQPNTFGAYMGGR